MLSLRTTVTDLGVWPVAVAEMRWQLGQPVEPWSKWAVPSISLLVACHHLRAVEAKKKADVVEHPKVFDHVGLLLNEPPGGPGCSLSSRPTTLDSLHTRAEAESQSPRRSYDSDWRKQANLF